MAEQLAALMEEFQAMRVGLQQQEHRWQQHRWQQAFQNAEQRHVAEIQQLRQEARQHVGDGDLGHARQRGFRVKDVLSGVPEFKGPAGEWANWSYCLKSTIGGEERRVTSMIEVVEKLGVEAKIGNIMTSLDGEDDEHTEAHIHGISSRQNLLLVSRCREEALEVVKAADQNGFLAWQRLYRKCSPTTMARAIHLLMAVTHPPKVKDLSSIGAALGRWETTQLQLKKEFDEEMTERMRIATITSMLPLVVQDYVLQNLDERARASESHREGPGLGEQPGGVGQRPEARGHRKHERRRGFLAAELL